MIKINSDRVISKFLVCPYCMNEVNEWDQGCCGEHSGHFSIAYELDSGEIYLENEIMFKD